jgi:xanthine/uracil permease
LLGVATIFYVYSYIGRQFRGGREEEKIVQARSRPHKWQMAAIVGGVVLASLSFVWEILIFRYIPNTVTGVVILLGPFFVLLVGGFGLALSGVVAWLWSSRRGRDDDMYP